MRSNKYENKRNAIVMARLVKAKTVAAHAKNEAAGVVIEIAIVEANLPLLNREILLCLLGV